MGLTACWPVGLLACWPVGLIDMQFVRDMSAIVTATWAEWGDIRLERLLYSEVTTARQILIALIGLAAIFVVIRSFGSRNPGHHRMALPALVKGSGWSRAGNAIR